MPKGLQPGCSSKGTSAGLPWWCRTLLQPWGGPSSPPPCCSTAAPHGQAAAALRRPLPTLHPWVLPSWFNQDPPLQAAPAGVAEGKDPSCPQQTPQLSPQKPPGWLLGVFLGKAARDGADPSKLVSFVAGAPPAPLGPPGGKASKGRCCPSASQIYSKCSHYHGLPPARSRKADDGQ